MRENIERKERKQMAGRKGRENEAEEEGSVEGEAEGSAEGEAEAAHYTAFMQKQVKVQERHANGKELCTHRKEQEGKSDNNTVFTGKS